MNEKKLKLPVLQIQVDESDQHQHGAEERVQEELERGVDPALAAPDADDQEHRHQHGFPQHVEQDAVERREDADHQAFEDQERREILRRTLLDRIPAGDDDQRRDERRQQDERRRDPVTRRGSTRRSAHSIQAVRSTNCMAAVVVSNLRVERDADDEGQHRDAERQPAHLPGPARRRVAAVADEQHRGAAGTIGSQIRRLRMFSVRSIRLTSTTARPRNQRDADEHRERVVIQVAGLDPAQDRRQTCRPSSPCR